MYQVEYPFENVALSAWKILQNNYAAICVCLHWRSLFVRSPYARACIVECSLYVCDTDMSIMWNKMNAIMLSIENIFEFIYLFASISILA